MIDTDTYSAIIIDTTGVYYFEPNLKYNYKVKGDSLIIFEDGGTTNYYFRVFSKDRLILKAPDGNNKYHRIKG